MPQPVDLQTELGRATAVERIQEVAGRASLAAVQRQAADFEQDRVDLETQVQQTHEAESEPVRADGRRRNPFAGRRHRRGTGEDEEAASDAGRPADTEEHHLDVTI